MREDIKKRILKELPKNLDSLILEKAITARWIHYKDDNIHNILLTYDIMKSLEIYSDSSNEFREIVRNNLKQNINLKKKNEKMFSIESLTPMGVGSSLFDYIEKKWNADYLEKNNGFYYPIMLESIFGFGLFRKGVPNYIISFNMINDKTVKVYQLQGVLPRIPNHSGHCIEKAGQTKATHIINCAELMFQYVCLFSKEKGFSEIGLQSSENNKWFQNEHMSLDEAKVYDLTAKKFGLEKRSDGDWYKSLN